MNRNDQNAAFHETFILNRRPYRNTSALLDCYSRDSGRLTLIAQGASRPSSRYSAALQPFVLLSVQWRGSRDLKTLTQAESLAPPYLFQGEALVCALYVNELLARLLKPYDADEILFCAYANTLDALKDNRQAASALREFELSLLHSQGVALHCLQTQNGNSILDDKFYYYELGAGFVESTSERNAYQGDVLLAIGARDWSVSGALPAAKKLCRTALQPLLGLRPLMSRALLE